MFGSCFLKLFLKTIFEKIENTILMLSKNNYCYLNLVFFVLSVFFNKKKLGTKHVSLFSLVFIYLFLFNYLKLHHNSNSSLQEINELFLAPSLASKWR